MPRRRRHREDWRDDVARSADRLGREAARFADRVNESVERMNDAFHDEWERRRSGYAYHAGEAGPGPNLHRLRRNMRRGKIAGVCAGLADYFGWRVRYVRLGAILATVFFFPLPIFAYVAAAVLMKRPDGPEPAYQSTEEERFWRTYSVKPKATYGELKHRFRALETRVEQMEYAVTSDEYGLRRQFRDLERGAV
jgi:phage shock protein C